MSFRETIADDDFSIHFGVLVVVFTLCALCLGAALNAAIHSFVDPKDWSGQCKDTCHNMDRKMVKATPVSCECSP